MGGRSGTQSGSGRVKSEGSEPLANLNWEAFCWAFVKKFSAIDAYLEAFPTNNRKMAASRASSLKNKPVIAARLRWILDEQSRQQLTKSAIVKDSIELGLWEVAGRCMESKRVTLPPELKARSFQPCGACEGEKPKGWCTSCQENAELLEAWADFGGVYKFDAKGAIAALIPLGKERGMFVERKLVGNLEGDELIDKMTDVEVRNLVRSLAGEVGLRVIETGSESPAGSEAPEGTDVSSVSEAGGIPQTRH